PRDRRSVRRRPRALSGRRPHWRARAARAAAPLGARRPRDRLPHFPSTRRAPSTALLPLSLTFGLAACPPTIAVGGPPALRRQRQHRGAGLGGVGEPARAVLLQQLRQ